MGMAKQAMIDKFHDDNAVLAEWECPEHNCGCANESDFEIPSIDMFSDHASDYSNSDNIEIICDDCGVSFEGTVYRDMNGLTFAFIDNQGETLDVYAELLEDELDYDDIPWMPSENPDDEFYVTMQGMRNLMRKTSPSEYDAQLLNRVIFTQIITAIEAYLSDTLQNAIEKDVEAQRKIYLTNKKMQKVSFKASKLLADQELPKKHLMIYLRGISFHNFPVIDRLYQNSLGTSIFANSDDRNLINKARLFRHHCVHRNGKDNDGKKLKIFNNEYVESIADAADRMISKIRRALAPLDFSDLSDEDN